MTERFDMVSVSLFKCACSHADPVLCVICVVCGNSCRVYYLYVPSRVFFLKWACVYISAVATVSLFNVWLVFPDYACIV